MNSPRCDTSKCEENPHSNTNYIKGLDIGHPPSHARRRINGRTIVFPNQSKKEIHLWST